jgi:hypothetical protein
MADFYRSRGPHATARTHSNPFERDRDPLPRPTKLDPSRESLQLAHFTTLGDLTRAFDTIAWDTDELSREVTWTAPLEPGLARFWLVLRDFRGGSAFVERSACVE